MNVLTFEGLHFKKEIEIGFISKEAINILREKYQMKNRNKSIRVEI
jgi:hypothetical protein